MAAEISPRAKAWLAVAAVPIILYTLLPIGWIVSLSLKPSADITDRNYFPRSLSWDNYKYIFTGGGHDVFVPALINSIGICLIATVLGVLLIPMLYVAVEKVIGGAKHTAAPTVAPSPTLATGHGQAGH